jgi:hypothetical protein
MASILNAQNNLFCLEDFPWNSFPAHFSSQEEFDVFLGTLEAKFLYLGLPFPMDLSSANNRDELIEKYINTLKQIFRSEHIGFKSTMMVRKNLELMALEKGFKVIIMRRNHEDILRSWVHRIEPDLDVAAARLQGWLEEINYYDIDFIPKEKVKIIDFDFLLNNQQQCLGDLSDFLDFPISTPKERYHSFNKDRFPFSDNSSFRSDASVTSVLGSLPQRYSDSEIRIAANKVEMKSALGGGRRLIILLRKIERASRAWMMRP